MAVTVSTLCCVSPAIAGTQCTPPRGVRAAAAACRGGRASVSGAAASFATLGARRAVAGGAASSLARDSRVTLALRAPKQRRNSVISASLFGVGAPEALVIGVVALLVFGPKGLAEIAKQLGGTLRAFQPTIRELQEVSREFRETLEDEIGLDEIRNGAAPTPVKRQAPVEPVVSAAPASAYDDSAAAVAADEQQVTEAMRKAASTAAWGDAPAPAQTEGTVEAAPVVETPAVPVPSDLSSEEGDTKA